MTTLARLGADDFLDALRALLPPGAAYRFDPDQVLADFWGAIADVEAAFHGRLAALTEVEDDPNQTVELLPDWEACFGLPDACAPQPQTLAQRRAALVARIADGGGESIPRLVSVAAQYGYAVTVTEFLPARIGQARCGDPLNGPAWIFAFQVHAPATTERFAEIGIAACGEPLASFGNATLECAIRTRMRGTRVVLFAYG